MMLTEEPEIRTQCNKVGEDITPNYNQHRQVNPDRFNFPSEWSGAESEGSATEEENQFSRVITRARQLMITEVYDDRTQYNKDVKTIPYHNQKRKLDTVKFNSSPESSDTKSERRATDDEKQFIGVITSAHQTKTTDDHGNRGTEEAGRVRKKKK